MSRSANVISIQTLRDFRIAMCNFAEDAKSALGGVDMELKRTRDWLERDQLGYWQAQVKKRQEEMMQARSDLHRRKISQQGSDAVSDAEQKEALREAQRRLRVAEEKVAQIKRLIPFLQREIDEYHSHSQPLGDHIGGGFEQALAVLDRMASALDSYVALRAPSVASIPETSATGSAAATTAVKAGSTAATPGSGVSAADTPAADSPATDTAEPASPASETDAANSSSSPLTTGSPR